MSPHTIPDLDKSKFIIIDYLNVRIFLEAFSMGCIQCHFSGEKLQNLGMLTILSQCLRFSGSTYAEILIYYV